MQIQDLWQDSKFAKSNSVLNYYSKSKAPSHKNYYCNVEGLIMNKKIVLHHYTECGLQNVWVQCLQATDDAGQKVITIPCIGSLHKVIAHGIVTSNGALTGPELKFLRTEMGLTQTELGELVDRRRLTIARWEQGESAPDGAAETLIRILVSGKLKLTKGDPEEFIRKRTLIRKTNDRIRIDMEVISKNREAANETHYRLVA